MSAEARIPQGAGFYNSDGQRLLNKIIRDPAKDAAAALFLVNHDAADLLEMLGLR